MTDKENNAGKPDKKLWMGIIAIIAVVAVSAVFLTAGNGEAVGGKDKPAASKQAATDKAQEDPMIRLGNPTVAVVNEEDIKRSDVFNFISGLPDQVRQMPIQNLFPMALEQVVNNKIVNNMASGAKLEGDPEVKQLLEQAQGQIVRNVFVERQVTAAVNQKKLLEAYGQLLDKLGDVQETHARHILIEAEDKAREVIKKLDGGASFEDMAKEFSTGPSAENGGDLGYFAKDQMVPEFSEAAFALGVGKYSKDPVKTQFGWHIIKVEDRRKRPEPQFEDVKPQLEQQLRQQILSDLLTKWQKSTKIEKFDINGDPVKKSN